MITQKNIDKTLATRRRKEQKEFRKAQLTRNNYPTKKDIADLMEIKMRRAHVDREQSRMFFFMGLSIALALIYIVFNWNFEKDGGIITLGNDELLAFEEVQDIPHTVQPPPPPPEIKQPPKIIEVADEVILEEVEIAIDVEATEDMAVEEVEYEMAPVEEEVAEEIFYIAETPPRPKDGLKAFYQFIGENLRYPQRARTANIKGKVFIQFVVDKEGNLTNFKVLKGIGYGCDEEAIRVLKTAPRWDAGKQRGVPVKVYMSIPIVFELK